MGVRRDSQTSPTGAPAAESQGDRGWRLSLVALAAIYATSLPYVYLRQIQPLYEYRGYGKYRSFGHEEISVGYYVVLTIIAVIPALWMRIDIRRPSEIAYWFLYALVFIPTVVLPITATGAAPLQWLGFSVLLLACMLVFEGFYRIPLRPIRRRTASNSRFFVRFLMVAAVIYAVLFYSFTFSLQLPSLSDVYDVRLDHRQDLIWSNPLAGYAVVWSSKVVNPMLIVLGLSRRKASLVIAGVLGQLLVFSMSGHKGVLFSILLIVALLASLRIGRFGVLFLGGLLLTMAAAILETIANDSHVLSLLIVRRVQMTPAILTSLYIEFFGDGPKMWLSHSIFSSIFTNPYGMGPTRLIGSTYFGPETSSNANIWADGFANFGYVGTVLFTFVLATIFRVTDAIAGALDQRIAVPMISMPAFSLTNSALLTCMLSHGWILTVLLLWWLPSERVRPAERDATRPMTGS